MQEDSTQENEQVSSSKMNGQVNFPNLETRQEKLERKRKRREMDYKSAGTPLVMANLSKNHQDYGMTPAEHLRAKTERLVGLYGDSYRG